jgi:hypothetical protein
MVFVPTEKKTANGVASATKTANGDAEKVGILLFYFNKQLTNSSTITLKKIPKIFDAL